MEFNGDLAKLQKSSKEGMSSEYAADCGKANVPVPGIFSDSTIRDRRRYSLIFRKLAEGKNEVEFSSVKNYLYENGALPSNFDSIWKLFDPFLEGMLSNEKFLATMWLVDQYNERKENPLNFEQPQTSSSTSPNATNNIILSILNLFQVHAQEFQNVLFEHEQEIRREQEQKYRGALKLKSIQERLIQIQVNWSDAANLIRKAIAKLQNNYEAKKSFESTISGHTNYSKEGVNPLNTFNTEHACEGIKSDPSTSGISNFGRFSDKSFNVNTTNPFLEPWDRSSSMSKSAPSTDFQSSLFLQPLNFSHLYETSVKSNESRISMTPSSAFSIDLSKKGCGEKKEN